MLLSVGIGKCSNKFVVRQFGTRPVWDGIPFLESGKHKHAAGGTAGETHATYAATERSGDTQGKLDVKTI